jgi:hypothetical protein
VARPALATSSDGTRTKAKGLEGMTPSTIYSGSAPLTVLMKGSGEEGSGLDGSVGSTVMMTTFEFESCGDSDQGPWASCVGS